MKPGRIVALGLLTASVATAGLAAAAGGAGDGPRGLSINQILARLAGQGYGEVRKIERERGRYEVKARAADGAWVKLYVDAATGRVVRRKEDD